MPYKSKITIDEMIDLYKKGYEPDEMAKMYGYKNGEYITSKLKQAKVYKSKRLDTGKILALRKAGWSVQEIAYEMITTEDEIKEVLKLL